MNGLDSKSGRVLRTVTYELYLAGKPKPLNPSSLVASLSIDAAHALAALVPFYAETVLSRSLLSAWERRGCQKNPVELSISDLA